LITARDAESGELRRIDLRSPALQREAEELRLASSNALRRSGVDSVDLSTTEPYDRTLVRFFEQRTRRR
jgi:hypothetical protein